MIAQILIQQIVFIIKCQLTMELSWSPRLENVLAQRRTTHATQCSNRSASVRFMVCGADHGGWHDSECQSQSGGKQRRSRRFSAAVVTVYFLLLASTLASFCFNGDQLLLLAGTHGGPTASPRGLP